MYKGRYFGVSDLLRSDTAILKGIENIPTKDHEDNMQFLIVELLDPAQAIYGDWITITSGYRGKELNREIKGSPTSDHCFGKAADMQCARPKDLFSIIRDTLNFDQLIYETKDKKDRSGKIIGQTIWIHASYRKGANRRQVFSMHNSKRTTPIITV